VRGADAPPRADLQHYHAGGVTRAVLGCSKPADHVPRSPRSSGASLARCAIARDHDSESMVWAGCLARRRLANLPVAIDRRLSKGHA
jgi:hypothetical protein